MSTPTVLITDLDNTIWDWFHAWHTSFTSMLDRLEQISGVPASTLEPEIRAVHQRRGTSEYSYLLNELPSLQHAAGDTAPLVKYDEAIHEMNSARLANTQLYPGVASTLQILRNKGVLIVAYTESIAYWTEWRIKNTGLDGIIDILYSAPDHDLPLGVSFQDIRKMEPEAYGLKRTVHRHVPKGAIKPNAAILRSILADCARAPRDALYVGDSLMKDIVMAQRAGVRNAYAKYGESQHRAEYSLLQRVSHWHDSDILREPQITAEMVAPQFVLERGFGEILEVFEMCSVGSA